MNRWILQAMKLSLEHLKNDVDDVVVKDLLSYFPEIFFHIIF